MIFTDIEMLSTQYKVLSDYFSLLQRKIDDAASKYTDLALKEKMHQAKQEVLGKDYIDVGNQFETTKELFCFGLGAILKDALRLGGLGDIASIEDFLTQKPEIKSAIKIVEFLYLCEALNNGMKDDAVPKLRKLRPELFFDHKHDNIWGTLNLKDRDFIDYCSAIKEFARQVDKIKS